MNIITLYQVTYLLEEVSQGSFLTCHLGLPKE